MNRLVIVLLVCGPGLAMAQQPGNVDPSELMKRFQDPAAMQRMAEQAQAAQKCMEEVDQGQLDALKKRAEAASAEIERLCEAGKKDEALAKGLALSRELRSDAALVKMRECAQDMSETVRGMMPTPVPGVDGDSDPTETDICS